MSNSSRTVPTAGKIPERALVVGNAVYQGLDVVSTGELSHSDRRRVEHVVQSVAPRGSLVGALVSSQPWDLRPVIIQPGEGGIPSVIRLFAPEVHLIPAVESWAETLLGRCAESTALRGEIADWGRVEGHLWVRRSVTPLVLVERLMQNEPLRLRHALDLALRIGRLLERLHSEGISHGHICAENVAIDARGELSLVDPFIAVTQVHSLVQLRRELPRSVARETFAPELQTGREFGSEVDLFGFGLVLREILLRAEQEEHRQARINKSGTNVLRETAQPLREVVLALTSREPGKRPDIRRVIGLLEEVRRTCLATSRLDEELSGEDTPSARQVVRVGQGKSTVQKEVPFLDPTQSRIRRSRRSRDESRAQPTVETPIEEVVEEKRENAQSSPQNAVSPLFLFVCVLMALSAIYFIRSQRSGVEESEVILSEPEMQAAWDSGVPSEMKPVVLAALRPEGPSPIARALILKSARDGDTKGGTVDSLLLRIAFDRQWEISLTPADRRATISLAVPSLLDESVLEDEPNLQELHPGVLLGLTVSRGKAAAKVLSRISAATLTRLPPPFNVAFVQYMAKYPNATLGDETVQLLARIGVQARLKLGGTVRREDIIAFLGNEFDDRLKALACILAIDHDQARKALNIILNESSYANESIVWAKAAGLMNWQNLGGSDQLLVLAGLEPAEQVPDDILILLARHPLEQMRMFAVKSALRSPGFAHSAKGASLDFVLQNPSALSPEQLFGLFRVLRTPALQVTSAVAKKWIETSPPMALGELLLVAGASAKNASSLDFYLARYLHEIGWNPSIERLEQLAFHPDRFTRFFAYSKLYTNENREKALEIVTAAEKREKDPEYLKQLRLIIKVLQLRPNADAMEDTSSSPPQG